jgi:hypothetical protein
MAVEILSSELERMCLRRDGFCMFVNITTAVLWVEPHDWARIGSLHILLRRLGNFKSMDWFWNPSASHTLLGCLECQFVYV